MTDFGPVEKTSLSDDLTERIARMIRSGVYKAGDRLPSILEMARRFEVGHPTVREALKKLEAIGVLEIKHGSGVFVRRGQDRLLVTNPMYGETASKKLMLDLIEARMPIELKSVELAAVHATEAHLERMAELLVEAEGHLRDADALNANNMAYHREIAVASGNTVLLQLQEVLTRLFQREQRMILDIYGSREKDHHEHVLILEELRRRDQAGAKYRMQLHLEGVREALIRWDPELNPV